MNSKESENATGMTGFQFRKPEQRTRWEQFQQHLYDPKNHTVCGRDAKSWGKLIVFYTSFYIGLAALFAICMQALLATLDDRVPRRILDDGLIGTNPGLGFQPISERTEEGSLIWYSKKNETTVAKWVNLLDKFLEPYKRNQTGQNFQPCDFGKTADPGFVCTVDLNKFGPCSPTEGYGYKGASPCVFLKLNKIFGWTPDFYTEPDPKMPSDLKEAISKLPSLDRSQIYISCKGEGPVDQEHVTTFNYYPSRGFPVYYFPYINTKNYLSPLIAVQIMNPKPNVIISIECRAWAKNINYRGGNLHREGSIHFEVMQDI